MHRNRTRLESQGISEGEILDEQLKSLRNQATWLRCFFLFVHVRGDQVEG